MGEAPPFKKPADHRGSGQHGDTLERSMGLWFRLRLLSQSVPRAVMISLMRPLMRSIGCCACLHLSWNGGAFIFVMPLGRRNIKQKKGHGVK